MKILIRCHPTLSGTTMSKIKLAKIFRFGNNMQMNLIKALCRMISITKGKII